MASLEVLTTLRVSEVFDSIQGEGNTAGLETAFLRLAHCNLKCSFCDTKYTWDFTAYSYRDEVRTMGLEELAPRLQKPFGGRLVVTGGEPLLQTRALEKLFRLLPQDVNIEVETNGTVSPTEEMLARVGQWNVSPKLRNSGEPEARRLKREVMSKFAGLQNSWLKLVAAGEDDCEEAMELIEALQWPKDRVFLMPMASTKEEYEQRFGTVSDFALRAGIRASPRLHIEKWGSRRGV